MNEAMTKRTTWTGCTAAILLAAGLCGCAGEVSAPGEEDRTSPSQNTQETLPAGERYTLSEEDKALYSAVIEQQAAELLALNPDYHIGYRLTFAELTGDEHAEMIITMCTEKGNSGDYLYTIKDGKVTGEFSWQYPALDGNLLVDEDGTVYEHYVFSPEIDGAKASYGYLTRYGNSPAAYFDFAEVTSNDKDAFIKAVDRVMWRAEGYHFIAEDELEKYKSENGYCFCAFELFVALNLDETVIDEAIATDLSMSTLIVSRETYDRLMEKEFAGLTDKKIPALTSDVITSPDGFDLSALKDITL